MWRNWQALAIASLATVVEAAGEGAGKFAAPAAAVAPQPIGGGGPGFLQIFGSLLLVIGTIVAIGWFAKRLKAMPRARGGALRIVDEIALGPKERAVLLEVDGARLVLGVGDGRVGLLHRSERAGQSTDSQDLTITDSSFGASGSPGVKFVDLLRQGLGK